MLEVIFKVKCIHKLLFSGSLPLHFGEWNSLTYLSLGLNKFESSLPTSLGTALSTGLLYPGLVVVIFVVQGKSYTLSRVFLLTCLTNYFLYGDC